MFEFGNGGGDTFLDGVQCGGNETSLLECKHDELGDHTCYSFRDPGVSCGNSHCISCLFSIDVELLQTHRWVSGCLKTPPLLAYM